MQATIKIAGEKVRLESNGLFSIKYNELTGRDIFEDVKKIEEISESNEEVLPYQLGFFYDIIYILAWFADRSIPADRNNWLLSFKDFDVFSIIRNQKVIDLLTDSIRPKE